MLKPDDIISFSEQIIFGSKQSWGKSWTQREIDGFFYNRFLNTPLQAAIDEARRRSFGDENPPYPCEWQGPEAVGLLVEPWGNGGSLDDLGEYFLGGSDPQVAHWDIALAVRDLHESFCLIENYLHCTLVHGTPVPFKRLYAFPIYGPERPHFKVVIYSLPVGPLERAWVKWRYDDFWKWIAEHRSRFGEPSPKSSTMSINLKDDGPFRLEIESDSSYISSNMFLSLVNQAIREYKSTLGGRTPVGTTIRTWTVHLFGECGFTNREAINLWNEKLGYKEELQYHIDDGIPPGPDAPAGAVTSSGESHYSRDKRELEGRIRHYQSTLVR